jgi:dolichol-phosphate mannosyltransferase
MPSLVIIPTYNERDNLPILVRQIMAYPELHVMVADDHSPDGTGEIADALAREFPGRIDVLHRTGPRGLGRSYLEAISRAITGDWTAICQMDGDLSHDPQYLPAMLSALEDHELAIGSRYLGGVSVVNWPLRRIVLSAFANHYIRLVTRLRVNDCTSGYRCWRRDALARLPLDRIVSEGYAFLVEMLYDAWQLGSRVTEVPIVFVERRHGTSKLSGRVLLESLLMPWRLVLRARPRGRRPGAAGPNDAGKGRQA